jgi:conjugal transfer pilus assembly protein TraA
MNTVNYALVAGLVAFSMLLVPAGELLAATTGSEWQTVFNRLSGWASGFLARSLAFIALLVGIGIGIAQGSAMPAVMGVVVALMASVFPAIANGMLTATV